MREHKNGAHLKIQTPHCVMALGITGAYLACALFRLITTPLWMDEVLAVVAAEQSSWSGVCNAIWAGTDFSPPTFHFLLHGLPGLATHTRLMSRLPSVLAVLGAASCVFHLARRRFEWPLALVAYSITLASPLFQFAVQARQYGLTTALLAAALLLWDGLPRALSGTFLRLFGLWAALALCVSLHFYGVVAVATIALCEALWSMVHRAWRWPVWLALGGVGLVFLAWLPLAHHLHGISAVDQLGPAFYGRPTWPGLARTWASMAIGGTDQVVIYVGLALVLAITSLPMRGGPGPQTRPLSAWPLVRDPQLAIMMAALAAIPLMAFLLAVLATGSFTDRYAAGASLLPGLLIASLLWFARKPGDAALWLSPAIVLAIGIQNADQIYAPSLRAAQDILQRAPRDRPVLLGNGLLYIELVGALPAAERARIAYLEKPAGAISPDPTNENEVLRLARFDPRFRAISFAAATRPDSRFYLLHTEPSEPDSAFAAAAGRRLVSGPIMHMGPARLYILNNDINR